MQLLFEFLANLLLDFPFDIIKGLSCLSHHLLSVLLNFLQTDFSQSRQKVERKKTKPKQSNKQQQKTTTHFQDTIVVQGLFVLLFKFMTLDV